MAAVPEMWIDPAACKQACDIASFLYAIASTKPQDANAQMVYGWAHDLDPTNAAVLNGLGRCALERKDWPDAFDRFQEACKLSPTARDNVNLALAADHLDLFEWAITCCKRALELDPRYTSAYAELYCLYERLGKHDKAWQAIVDGLEVDPHSHDLLFQRATLLMRDGRYDEAWLDYEHRPTKLQIAKAMDEYPEWDGSPLAGKTLLVCRESGLGDTIMFSRYLPVLDELGGQVVLYTYPELATLFAASYPFLRIVTCDIDLQPINVDCWVSMESLPLKLRNSAWQHDHFGTSPYLSIPKAARIPEFLSAPCANLRIGLCWRGNPQYPADELRSMSFDALRPLLDTPGCDFYSLQYHDSESGLVNLRDYCHDIAELAAVISKLDLVITVDTMMGHLTGAVAKPAWILLGPVPHWPWGRQSADTDWYPSVELIRSTRPKEWADPVDSATDKLRSFNRGLQRVVEPINVATVIGQATPEDQGVHGFAPASINTLTSTVGQMPAAVSTEDSRFSADREHAHTNTLWKEHTDIITRACRYGEMSWYPNDHYIGQALNLYGEYSEGEVDLFRRILKRGDVVVEAGANIGALTLPLAHIVCDTGTVWAFEAQPEYAQLLAQNLQRSPQRSARLWGNPCLALGLQRGQLDLPEIPLDIIHSPGIQRSTNTKHSIEQIDLDSCKLDQLDFLKIDVDGQELDILKGAIKTIARCRPMLYVEYDKPEAYPDMLEWITNHGYRIYKHCSPLFNPQNFAGNHVNVFGSIISLMLLCIPDERRDLRAENIGLGLTRLRLEKK